MAAMTTVLKEHADYGNARTYTAPGHTALVPQLVLQKRKVLNSPDGNIESSVAVVFATKDTAGLTLQGKIRFEAVVRFPAQGDADDVAAAKALFREIIASDNFDDAVDDQNWVQ